MPKRHVPQFMRDHRGHFLGVHNPVAVFVHESPSDENPPVRGREAVNRVDFVNVHFQFGQIELRRHFSGQGQQGRVFQLG